MEQLIEALASAGTHYVEERFGKLAAYLYVVALIALSLGMAALFIVFGAQYLR